MSIEAWLLITAFIFTVFGFIWGSGNKKETIESTLDQLIDKGYLRFRKDDEDQIELLKWNHISDQFFEKELNMDIVYGVRIEIDEGEFEYVREGDGWMPDSPFLTFDTKEDALIEAKKWNTGVVVNLSKLPSWKSQKKFIS